MRYRPLLKWRFEAPLNTKTCVSVYYPVLSIVSNGYPRLKGRLPIHYSPVRHWCTSTPVWLACIRHAASVHPEPGSNSPFDLTQNVLANVFLINLLIVIREYCFSWIDVSCLVFKDRTALACLPQRSYIIPNHSLHVKHFFYFFFKKFSFFYFFMFLLKHSYLFY